MGTAGLLNGAATLFLSGFILVLAQPALGADVLFEDAARPILEAKCFKCHGADRAKRKAELDLRDAASIVRGGESGGALVAGSAEDSLLWQMIEGGDMPPEGNTPLTDLEREAIKLWIVGGAKARTATTGLTSATEEEKNFWSFRRNARPKDPAVTNVDTCYTTIDRFVLAGLEQKGLSFAEEATRVVLVRRLYLDLIGLPPTPTEMSDFVNDPSPNAYEKLVDKLLASPHYGERWGQQWLDTVGYADSNGYIRYDSPRPLAYRYRDYVIRSLNEDKPYDRLWLEQLAGDELVNYPDAESLSPDQLDSLIATHFLRNAPDGTDNTEGNEATRTMERYAVLEGELQITMSAMFGMTIECARCHSHKFDPIPHTDYYALQAILYPAFNVKDWTQPKKRWIYAAGKAELAQWQVGNKSVDRKIAALRTEFEKWLLDHRPPGQVVWQDDFDGTPLEAQWTNTVPGDDHPAGLPAVRITGAIAPAAGIEQGRLALAAAVAPDSTWLATQQTFEWGPKELGEWIQVTFDLVDNRLFDSAPAERIGYFIALHDYDDSSDTPPADGQFDKPKGNILIDGNPAGGAQVYLDYPGRDQKAIGFIGSSGYEPGHNFGVRITRVGAKEFLLQHVVDGRAEKNSVRLTTEHVPKGSFGFELSCGRSFVVDHFVVESSQAGSAPGNTAPTDFAKDTEARSSQLKKQIADTETRRVVEPQKLAWVTDLSEIPPEVPLLKRGNYFTPGPTVLPGPLSVLVDPDNSMEISPPASHAKTTGRRLAFARWATKPGSRAAALLARVEVDRIWRGHFGRGLVPTPENFGASGVPPTHPELLEWLTAQFMHDGWRQKAIHRLIVLSRTYRQSAISDALALDRDEENLQYSRFPARRLDAEAIRDSMLSVAGVINLKQFGPAVDFVDHGNRQITLPEPKGDGPHEVDRRSIYLRHRRSQPIYFLEAFDLASPEPNCVFRPTSTVVAQSLAMLNGDFAVRMSREFAKRLEQESADKDRDQIVRAFQIALCREPSDDELENCSAFLAEQRTLRAGNGDASPDSAALADFCRLLLATNEFMYLQ
ncbi:MAG: PSD1 and planctomycete cytochrome C domain-containing protein [Pirellulales bacterium]